MTEANPVVLVVDDEVQIRRFLRAGLELDGFAVQDAGIGDALRWATPAARSGHPISLPDMDGAEVLDRLAPGRAPIIVPSVRSNEAEKVRLLENGADDYGSSRSAWPAVGAGACRMRHVRVSTGEPVVKIGPLAIDLAARMSLINGTRMLTPGIPAAAARAARRQRRHPRSYQEGWGSPHRTTPTTCAFVRKLRQKIEADPTSRELLTGSASATAWSCPSRPTITRWRAEPYDNAALIAFPCAAS
jgi:two-component system KDP operon response regulator KdpE